MVATLSIFTRKLLLRYYCDLIWLAELVSAVRDTIKRVSREIEVPAVPNNTGVGPDELIGGDLHKEITEE